MSLLDTGILLRLRPHEAVRAGDEILQRVGREMVLVDQNRHERKQREPRDHMTGEGVQRFLQKMTVGDGYEYESERNEGLANAKPEDEQPAGDQFHDRDDQSDRPEQPDWD